MTISVSPIAALSTLALWLALSSTGSAQNPDELAKQTQNPVSSLISVPLQGNWDFGIGDRDATSTLLNIQPVTPFWRHVQYEPDFTGDYAAHIAT